VLLACAVAMGVAPGSVRAQMDPAAEPVLGSTPLAIDIPKIGTHAQVVPLGQDDDGTMQAPTDPDTVGWYALGVGVGAPGNALLDGHVDWGGRLRVFGLLKQLEPGDAIQITDVAGTVFSYSVAWTRLYAADTAPLDEVFEQTSAEEVTLITCGGAFDRSIRMYLSRWIVRATRIPEVASAD
jgi:LPXTG-site transpeptidase (sortase) family protein